LIKLLNKSKTHLAWSQVKAHTGIHWNEKADEKAKDAAEGRAQPSRGNFRNVTLVPTHELHMDNEEEVQIQQPTGYLEEDRDTTILSIPMEDIGQLCNLVPTQNLVRQR
jgi:hypothetical protein